MEYSNFQNRLFFCKRMSSHHLLRSNSKYQLDTRSLDILFNIFLRSFSKRKKKCEVNSHVITCQSKGSEIFIRPPISYFKLSLTCSSTRGSAPWAFYLCCYSRVDQRVSARFIHFFSCSFHVTTFGFVFCIER